MHKLSFWHKLAFIANICWLLTWVMKYYNIIPSKDLQSTVIVLGLVVSQILNIIVNIVTGVLFVRSRMHGNVPRWLLMINFLFLLAQLYLYIK